MRPPALGAAILSLTLALLVIGCGGKSSKTAAAAQPPGGDKKYYTGPLDGDVLTGKIVEGPGLWLQYDRVLVRIPYTDELKGGTATIVPYEGPLKVEGTEIVSKPFKLNVTGRRPDEVPGYEIMIPREAVTGDPKKHVFAAWKLGGDVEKEEGYQFGLPSPENNPHMGRRITFAGEEMIHAKFHFSAGAIHFLVRDP